MLYSIVIGKNIVMLRKEKGLSQEELAYQAAVSISRLRDIEHGRANTSLDLLESIATALQVDLLVLFFPARRRPCSSVRDCFEGIRHKRRLYDTAKCGT